MQKQKREEHAIESEIVKKDVGSTYLDGRDKCPDE